MQHFPKQNKKTTQDTKPDPIAPEIAMPRMQDRADQRFTNFIGGLFSISSFLCLIGIAVLGLFFVRIVAQGGETGMLPIFVALGGSLVLGMLLLDFTHARALSGYRAARMRNARYTKALFSGLLCIFLGMIHPLMALAIPVSAGFGVLMHLGLRRLSVNEPLWDFLPKEAISILSGRDRIGLEMTATRPVSHALSTPVTRASNALAVISALAAGSYLIAANIMTMAAFIPLVLGSAWASDAIVAYAESRFSRRDTARVPASRVERIENEQDDEEALGLNIGGLTVRDANGQLILTDVDVQVGPGQITGIVGTSGAGKSLLLKAIADPFSISNAEVSGRAFIGRTDLWSRQSSDQNVPFVLLPPEPIVLPASGANNLSCFHDGEMLTRGRWFLERLVFAIDIVDNICNAPDAQALPSMQLKALALARAFLLAPPLYLMDRPEDGLPDKQIFALVHRLEQQARMGRSVLMVTNNRALLESCHRLIVMQNGRIVDYGLAADVTDSMDSGWSRFRGTRRPDTEEVLVNWVRSHFFRDGDEANRRKVAGIASDLLALSCQSADVRAPGEVQFHFKNFDGHCLLRMSDEDPAVGTSTIQKVKRDAASTTEDHNLSPLASVYRQAEKVECDTKTENRRVSAQIEIYDPRKTGGGSDGS